MGFLFFFKIFLMTNIYILAFICHNNFYYLALSIILLLASNSYLMYKFKNFKTFIITTFYFNLISAIIAYSYYLIYLHYNSYIIAIFTLFFYLFIGPAYTFILMAFFNNTIFKKYIKSIFWKQKKKIEFSPMKTIPKN